MLHIENHVKFIKKCLHYKGILYHQYEHDRISHLFWALNSLRILKSSYFHEAKGPILEYTILCLNKNGSFSPSPNFEPNIISTFYALQILSLVQVPFYSEECTKYILNLQSTDGSFCFDNFGQKDSRFDCCAVLALKILDNMQQSKLSNTDLHEIKLLLMNERKGDLSFRPEVTSDITKKLFLNQKELAGSICSSYINQSFLESIGFDQNLYLKYILELQNFDGGFGQIKNSESHVAQTFCVISSLKVLDQLDKINTEKAIEYIVYRQQTSGGFNGRIDKEEDSCYSFFALASLEMMDSIELVNKQALIKFILSCQKLNGGFSDHPNEDPDIFHLHFSLCALSLMGKYDIAGVNSTFTTGSGIFD